MNNPKQAIVMIGAYLAMTRTLMLFRASVGNDSTAVASVMVDTPQLSCLFHVLRRGS